MLLTDAPHVCKYSKKCPALVNMRNVVLLSDK